MAGNQAAWGLDVGVSSLKALKLRRDGDRVTIEAFDVVEHDKFLTEPDVDRDSLIRATLQKFATKNAVRRDVCFIGVPGSTTFARFVKLPPVETKKIPEIVRFEAVQQIPFPLDQVNWDFHTFQHPDSPDVEVGIFAMKKELVAAVMSNFRAVDLNVQGVQMSPLAVYNGAAYDGMTQDKGTVVIDMGAEHTDLVVMDQGRAWLRSINIGGNHFTDALAKSFKQPFARAETLKKTAATSKYQKQIYQAMRPIFADLVAEIQRGSLGAYNSAHRDSKLERIVGMGNPFKLPNLQKYLQQELKMDVERLESYRMANVEKAAAFSENILSMTTAYGLAVQALGLAAIDTNLLPSEMARAMMWKKKQPWFIGSTALVGIGALAIGMSWYMASASLHSSTNEVIRDSNNRHHMEAEGLVNQWKGVNDNFENTKKLVDKQFDLLAGRKVWPMIMADIWQSLPQSRGSGQVQIILTDVTEDYTSLLSTKSTVVTAAAGPGLPGAGAMPVAPVGASGVAATSPSNQVGPSDHGYVVTISGYYAVPQQLISQPYVPASTFRTDLVQKADAKNVNKPYYYESDTPQSGRLITMTANPNASASSGTAGAFGSPMMSTTPQAGNKPWGNVKGPYWEIFVPDMIGVKLVPPVVPGAMGTQPTPALGEIQALDLVATRAKPQSPTPVTMNNRYTFTLKFKVHIKDDFKEAPPPAPK